MVVGIIGGSGIGASLIERRQEHDVATPYGKPSMPIIEGTLNNTKVLFLLRHGKDHEINPTEVNYRANIWALKQLGAVTILTVHAVGSLQESYKPGELVFPDQFIDRTTMRAETFYDRGKTMHISMAHPYCSSLRDTLAKSAARLQIPAHNRGTAVVMEGPRFSTRAESELYRSWKADIISMTLVPECILAREIGLHCAAIAMVTDYDCWRDSVVDMEMILKIVKENAEKVHLLLTDVVPKISPKGCSCAIDFQKAFA